MLFNFCLTPVEKIQPWGKGDDLELHWYGLTYGCYWLLAGDVELFRHSEEFPKKYGWTDYYGCLPHEDYQVAHLWQDVLDILPDVLLPVPQVLTEKLAAPNFQAWRAAVYQWALSKPNGLQKPAYGYANEWARKRHLDHMYLIAGPRIWLWNDGTFIHLEWDNREQKIDGIPKWSASMGSWRLTVEAFLDEVRAFDHAFLHAMQQRVMQVARGWNRPDVHIDKGQLAWQQHDCVTHLAQSLAKAQNHTEDWNAVLDAIAFIDAEIKP